MPKRSTLACAAALLLCATGARAADAPAMPQPSMPQPAAPQPAASQSCKATISLPAYNGVIKQNPNPACVTVDGLGDIYVGGAISGYAYTTRNPQPFSSPPLPDDRAARVDFSNAQAFIQKADGPFQFYVQPGLYVIPQLGVPNFSAVDQTRTLFTPLPIAFGKIVLSDQLSISGGRLPGLIGTEVPFSFQNLNIQRGLLFAQTIIINQGIQITYADGPWTVQLAGTDGFFSGQLSWFSGLVSYKIDDANTVGVDGGLNLDRTNELARSLRYRFATTPVQQNSGVINVYYAYSSGPWIFSPSFQFIDVDRDPRIGISEGASSYAGSILASYAFTDTFALAGRVEVEQQTGVRGVGSTSLLYGPGSGALSFTVTPTFTIDRYFLRGEYAHVELLDFTPGLGFGRTGTRASQDRFLIETGFTF